MSVIKVLRDLNGLFNYSTDENPTSQQDYQKAVKNWVKTIVSLVDSNLWQPETEYTVGSQLLTPSLPYYVLRCTVAGTSGAAEPDYTDVALDDEITDGTVTWVVDGYLPLSGGTLTGDLTVKGTITGNLAGNADTATNATNATNDANGNPIAGTYLPAVVGAVVAFAGKLLPTGWLLCDGSAVSRTDYAALFAVIGTTYGAGNGSTTFNLPNLVDKFIEGSATSGTEKSAGLPNITGKMYNQAGSMTVTDQSAGAFKDTNPPGAVLAGASSGNYGYGRTTTFDASRSNAIYGNSNTVQPPALTMRYIIKY